jgi:biopolymer transport protein ExbD
MTPMVDVVMVILVFFMAAASFVGPEWFLRATLPAEGAAGGGANESFALPAVEVTIGLRRVEVGGAMQTVADWPGSRGLSLERVAVEIGLAAPGLLTGGRESAPSVVLVPEDAVPYADVVRVHAACVAAGLEKVMIR